MLALSVSTPWPASTSLKESRIPLSATGISSGTSGSGSFEDWRDPVFPPGCRPLLFLVRLGRVSFGEPLVQGHLWRVKRKKETCS